MKQIDLVIQNPSGLHARPAAVFVQTAKKFKSDIRVKRGAKKANAKSALSILTLGASHGSTITLIIDGPDEDEALETLAEAVRTGLGDEIPDTPTLPQAEAAAQSQVDQAGQSTPVTQTQTAPDQSQAKAATPTEVVNPQQNGTLQAIAGAPGLAIGPLFQHRPTQFSFNKDSADPGSEKVTLKEAILAAHNHLQTLQDDVTARLGSEEGAIFAAHQSILDDPDLLERAETRIDQGESAPWAWQQVIDEAAAELAAVSDKLLAARAADIRDAGQQVLRILTGQKEQNADALPDYPVILVATDLSPTDTVSLDLKRILGFCTAGGGANAHTAILARSLGLPALVGGGETLLTIPDGTPAILDGNQGTLTLNPTTEEKIAAEDARTAQQSQRSQELASAGEPAQTIDGHRVEIAANIGGAEGARKAVEMGAEAVGLLRTEFLFLQRTTPPTLNEQTAVYRLIAQVLQGRPAIVRTLDVGGDKPLAYLPMPDEENPFLGERGIRLCLNQPDILRTQLTAILQALEAGPLHIMFPMITDISEWEAARSLVDEAAEAAGSPPLQIGMMIEVPAAALLADVFAPHVDFFSIGTNDLTQYTLAMDRTNPAVSATADGLHPAVLRLINRTVEAAHAAGKWVGVCGELGADPQAVPILVGLDVDELSVTPPAVPGVKAQIRTLNRRDCRTLAQQALQCRNATEVRALPSKQELENV